jgi:hydroxyacylglutathione hydrolase
LAGGLAAWAEAGLPVERIQEIGVVELRRQLERGAAPIVLDVRQDDEWLAGHIPSAVHIENGRLPYTDLPLPPDQPIAVHCQHRNRSTAGLSVLARRGFRDLLLVDDGFAAWARAGFPVERGA